MHYLTEGTVLGCTEGPHLLEKDGFFYLILAEGGTEYDHAVSIARSKDIMGPYTYHPDNPILSAKDSPAQYLQRQAMPILYKALKEIGTWSFLHHAL